MTIRRLWVLVRGLPRTSNTVRAAQGEAADWTVDTTVLARIANTLVQANSTRWTESDLLKPPKPKPRPGR